MNRNCRSFSSPARRRLSLVGPDGIDEAAQAEGFFFESEKRTIRRRSVYTRPAR